jgi:glycosyltransferase involved in cell wall biosynthesis
VPQSDVYYTLKPYLPYRVRMLFRRILARNLSREHSAVWPINEQAGKKPANWPGWPGGSKFAFVLTHDVENLGGYSKTLQLMQLEKDLGFRSSFNFIPEDEYQLTREMRQELESNGFEVGVHDLHHDGKLFRTREEFASKARHINNYIHAWGAHGFRSGFMRHNLQWAHELDVMYDASTFDTDPMEPQPDAAMSIFPFWNELNGNGYVELPYTLPQDSTLYLLLKEQGPVTWKHKLKWLAEKGGMVLLDSHPDYISFNRENATMATYPAKWYREFLEHVKETCAGQYWNPLPRELACWYRLTLKDPSLSPDAALEQTHKLMAKPRAFAPGKRFAQTQPKRVLMITHSIYETDNRVARYANALAERGDNVEVLALKRDARLPDTETIGKVLVHRMQLRSRKDQRGQGSYLMPILKFWLKSSAKLSWKHLRNRYDVIHVHNVPDFLVFAAWLPRITGARVILDIHDMVPEFYASKFRVDDGSMTVKSLKFVERISARFAHHVIISNHLWHKIYVERSVELGRCSVFINRVDSKLFYQRECSRKDGKQIIMFPGGLQWHQGLDIAIRAMVIVRQKLPNAEFHIYGDGNMKDDLVALAKELNLGDAVKFFEPLPAAQIAQAMADADAGVVPKRADSFGNEAYSTKIMEFMSVGVPVVVSSTKIDRFYFNDKVVRFFESGNHTALAEGLVEVLTNEKVRREMVANATQYASENSWEARKSDYLLLVDSLCSTSRNIKRSGPLTQSVTVDAAA